MKIKLAFLSLLISSLAFAQKSHADSLNYVVDEYYRLNLKIFQSGSDQNDIDSLFMLFTDDFTYILNMEVLIPDKPYTMAIRTTKKMEGTTEESVI